MNMYTCFIIILHSVDAYNDRNSYRTQFVSNLNELLFKWNSSACNGNKDITNNYFTFMSGYTCISYGFNAKR